MTSNQTNYRNMELEDLAVQNFREYLRIPSIHPNVNYAPCIAFLESQAKSMELQFRTYEYHIGKPIALLTLNGTDPQLPAILLNSHMDVVPVFEDKWTYKPFDAHMDELGNIYARGSQDMKSVGIQYLEAVRRLQKDGVKLKRTLHLSFVPDEEIGGWKGMAEFVKTNDFKNLNIGFTLDEGLASPNDIFSVYYGERSTWQMHFHCTGQPGHGSRLPEGTAGEKVNRILNKLYEFRNQEMEKLNNNPDLTLGDVTTINLTQLKGGVQSNVIPEDLIVVIDCRIPVTVNMTKWEETLNQWCKEAGDGVWIEFEQKQPEVPVTPLDNSNIYWLAFKAAADKMKLELKKEIFIGGTDSRYIRRIGIPAIGFSPMNNTPVLLHDNDEFLNVKVFLRGIDIYYQIIQAVANT